MTYDPLMLLEAYRRMRAIREFEERMRREVQAGTVPGFVHLYCGQEAVAVGACMNLLDSDYIGSTHRGHGHCIAKGCDIGAMLLEIYCKQGGLCNGKGGSMHIADLRKGMLGANAIVGGAPPIAIGAALTHKTLGNGRRRHGVHRRWRVHQGTVAESLNFSAVLKLPMIFMYENNGYSEFTGTGYHLGGADIAARAAAFGMPAEKWMAWIFSRSTTRWLVRSSARAAAMARARSRHSPCAGMGTSKATCRSIANRRRLSACASQPIRSSNSRSAPHGIRHRRG